MNESDKLIVLDRDGVINFDSDDYIKSVEEWIPIPGSIEAIAKLSQSGYQIFIATNQSGIGRGYYDITTLNAMHDKLESLVGRLGGTITGIVYCPHKPDEFCICRKPNTGLLTQIEENFNVKLKGQPFVGDSLKDLQCAQSFNCQGILVRSGKGEITLKNAGTLVKDAPVFLNLAHYVTLLLSDSDSDSSANQ